MFLPHSTSIANAASAYEKCLTSSGAPNVEAVVGACQACFNDTSSGRFGIARGALWFGSRDSDVTTITKGQTSVSLTLWGTVYSCVQTGHGTNPASKIWFASAGSFIGNSYGTLNNAVNFLSPNNASISMSRGNGQGLANTWSSPIGSRSGAVTLDVEKFKNYSGTTEEVKEENGKTVRYYTATVSINRCYGSVQQYYNPDGSRSRPCYGDDSRIVIKEIEDTPPPPPDPTPPSTGGWTSDVEVTVTGRDGAADHTIKSGIDMEAAMAVSSDDTFTVKFVHTFYFEPPDIEFDVWINEDVVPPSCIDYEITTEGIGGGVIKGSYCADTKGGATSFQVPVTVQLSPGLESRNWATSTNKYGNLGGGTNYGKSYSYPVLDKVFWWRWSTCGSSPNTYPCKVWDVQWSHWVYDTIGSGTGSAAGAVSALKPKDPETKVTVSPGFIYAGETTDVSWDVSAKGWHERRLMSMQSPIYQVRALSSPASSFATENRSYGADPMGLWNSRQSGIWQTDITAAGNYQTYGNGYIGVLPPNTRSKPFQAPDETGDKFCSTYGYEWQYYWAYGENFGVGARPVEDEFSNWSKDNGGKTHYWFIFGSSCRTIVKKPTVALWNGGLLTNGGVSVSLANRHWPRADFGGDAGGKERRRFSSWTEYLGVINGGVTNFGTGASYARGATGITNPLTIANRNGDGGSGITTSNTFRTRLNTYLRTAATNTIDEMYDRSSTDNRTLITVLADPSGTNWITRNIKIDGDQANGTYDSIYQLPQNVIFVDGNLHIDPSVTRIDAWLIVNGELNTCPSFASGSTETTPGGNRVCDNQLIFNGPVLANTLKLNRSYGADPVYQGAQYTPAEVFNLSADSYLWAYAQAGRYGSSYTESYSRELAPRY